jgi:YHS domain-containing protein
MHRRYRIAALAAVAVLAGGIATQSGLQANVGPSIVYVDESGVALGGYDPVGYYRTGAATPGDDAYELRYDGSVYHFASVENLTSFEADPARYLPRYGGFCAYGVRMGRKLPIDPTAFDIVDGRLYLFLDRATRHTWHQDETGNIQIADKIWPELMRAD